VRVVLYGVVRCCMVSNGMVCRDCDCMDDCDGKCPDQGLFIVARPSSASTRQREVIEVMRDVDCRRRWHQKGVCGGAGAGTGVLVVRDGDGDGDGDGWAVWRRMCGWDLGNEARVGRQGRLFLTLFFFSF
jgi:hypothetical protein